MEIGILNALNPVKDRRMSKHCQAHETSDGGTETLSMDGPSVTHVQIEYMDP